MEGFSSEGPKAEGAESSVEVV